MLQYATVLAVVGVVMDAQAHVKIHAKNTALLAVEEIVHRPVMLHAVIVWQYRIIKKNKARKLIASGHFFIIILRNLQMALILIYH